MVSMGAGRAGAAPPRVGYANVSVDPAAEKAIDDLRAAVRDEKRFDELSDGIARAALEEPVDPADSPEANAVRRAATPLRAARDAYDAFEYDRALDELRVADSQLRSVAPTPEVIQALAEVNLLTGLVHVGRQDELKALVAFRLVRTLDPTRTSLDKKMYRPLIVQIYERAQPVDQSRGSGTVSIATEPSGATVWLDGKNLGTTPASLPGIEPGEHYLAVSLDGHAPRHEKIRVGADKPVELSLLLSRLPAEDRAAQVRTALLRPAVTELEWKKGAAALADSASVDLLILVRDADGGGLEGAVYDARRRTLGAWKPAGDPQAVVATLPHPEITLAVPAKAVDTHQRPIVEEDRGERTPWYSTPWGTATIIGGTVLVTAAVIFLAAPAGDVMQLYNVGGPVWE
jgi:hypothetical protein